MRARSLQPGELWFYNGETLDPAKLNSRIKSVFSWDIGPKDELWVVQTDGTLLTELASGEVTESTLPEPGKHVCDQGGNEWLLGTSGVPYRRTESGWQALPIPASAWSSTGGPILIRDIFALRNQAILLAWRREQSPRGLPRQSSATAQ
jgi:hypothetical protein